MSTVMDGVIVGGAGGAIAGLTVYLVQYVHGKAANIIEGRRILNWLNQKTNDKAGEQFRSTRAIAIKWTPCPVQFHL